MKKQFLLIVFLLTIFMSYSCKSQNGNTKTQVTWYSIDKANEMAQKDGKKAKLYFIDCYTSWCGWCKVLDNKTFTNDTIARILNHYFYPCKFDAESKEPITINGTTYNPSVNSGNRKTHELMKVLWEGQTGAGYPTMCIRKSDFSSQDVVMGYLSANDLEPWLSYYALGMNKQMSYEKFEKNYLDKYQKQILKEIY